MYLKNIKEKNIASILEVINNKGPISKKDVSLELNLSPASLTMISKDLLEKKILIETGEVVEKKAGRRKQLLKLNYDYKYSIGVSIQPSKTEITIINLEGKVIEESILKNINPNIPHLFFKEISTEILSLVKKNKIVEEKILGLGVSIIGRVNSSLGKTLSNIGFWEEEVEVQKELSKNLPYKIIVENNVSALALYESFLSPELKKFFFLKYDRGIGGANVVNSTLLKENNDSMGEMGHTILELESEEYCPVCKRKGCLENSISTHKIIEMIKNDFNQKKYPILHKLIEGDQGKITFEKVLKSAELGGIKECMLLKKSAKLIAVTILNTHSLIMPEKIVLYGRLFRSSLYMDYLNGYFREFQLTNFSHRLVHSKILVESEALAPAFYIIKKVFYERV